MTGRATLVGGGPGREDLLTLAAVRALEAADVELDDRLAPHEGLGRLAPTVDELGGPCRLGKRRR